MLRQLHLFFCLFFIVGSTVAQQYNFRKYSIEDGLPRSATYSLCQDRHGFLWIGLDGGGVAMFNGESFKTFDLSDGLPSHEVRAVFEDSKGNMWFGTTAGLCRYDFLEIQVFTIEDGLANDYIRTIEEDANGRIWIGTKDGLSIYDGEGFQNYHLKEGLLHQKVRIVKKMSDGSMWVGTDAGVNIFKNYKAEVHPVTDSLISKTVLELFEDRKHNIWIGTKNGLVKWNHGQTKIFTTEDGLIQNRIRAISQDLKGHIWVGTRAGVSEFDGEHFTNYNHRNGLSHNRIRDILLDDRGNLWFATYYGGIDRYAQDHFLVYTTNEGLLSDQVFTISGDDNGQVLFGTFDGPSLLKDGVVHPPIWAKHLKDPKILASHQDEYDRIWLGTKEGVLVVDNGLPVWFDESNGLIDKEVTAIHQQGSTYWIGTEKGVTKIVLQNPQNVRSANVTSLPISKSGFRVSVIQSDEAGRTWIGYRNGKIDVIDRDGELRFPNLPDDLYHITSMVPKGKTTWWVGTDARGLFEMNFSKGVDQAVYDRINLDNGLASNHIYALLPDRKGNLWVGTEKGIDYLYYEHDSLTHISHFGKEEGLIGIEVNENAVFLDRKGNPWFGTVSGAVNLSQKVHTLGRKAPVTYITDVWLFDERLSEGNSVGVPVDSRFKIPQNFSLAYDKNSLSFGFFGVNLTAPNRVKYSWKLVGFDKDYTEPSYSHQATYTNLPAGDYRFEVISCNEDGVWNKEPTTITFSISTPFWKTMWFWILAGVLGFLCLNFISQWRVRRLTRVKLKLENQIAEATQELRSEKELVEQKNGEIESQKLELEEINQSFTDSINYAQRIQRAMMEPQAASTDKIRAKSFVFHSAKDIVSGDFFWFRDQGNTSFIAAADCTGHGVPGAFMSMIGIAFLNQIINKSSGELMPNDILFKQRELVVQALEGEDQSKDGMDMAICRIDWDYNKAFFAGAYNSLYRVRKGVLTEIKANKMPIGASDFDGQPFDLHELDLEKGDMIYLYSDGYPDQFGGPKGKKYKYRPFKFFLESISDFPLEKQKAALENELKRWMGDAEQNDDILVLGIRV